MSQALATLGLEKTATLVDIKARWRELAKIHHPDVGGDAAEFERYQKAYRAACDEASAQRLCPECKGVGRVLMSRGFSNITLSCHACGGTGVVK